MIQDSGNNDIINTKFAQIRGAGPSQIVGAKLESHVFLNAQAHLLEPLDVSTAGCSKDELCIPSQGSQPLEDGQRVR